MKNHSNKRLALPTTYLSTLLVSVLFGMLLLLAMHYVQAEPLNDPTQPPASSSNGVIGDNSTVASGPALHSVMIGLHYRAAIINGQKIMLGGKYENATLIRINEREVVLRNPDMSTQILAMDYAAIKKMPPNSKPK